MQANIKRTIGGVENIYKFPARATDALALLDEIDNDHTALLEVFHDLSVLLSTLSVAEEHIQQLRVQASIARVCCMLCRLASLVHRLRHLRPGRKYATLYSRI